MFYKKYLEDNYLVIESFLLKEKIAINSINDIVILHDRGWNEHKLFMYFNQPVEYELTKSSIFYRILFRLFLNFNSNNFKILRSYEDDFITEILNLLKLNLPTLIETQYLDLNHSFTWRIFDDGMWFKQIKLVYSKENYGLKKVLLKYGFLKNEN
ncbi:hypothetical protein [Chryseobacterium sp. M5A1_1a]